MPTYSASQKSLAQSLNDNDFYAVSTPAETTAAVADNDDSATSQLTQAQIIAQAAYSMVATAGQDDRMTLIKNA